ncbi:lysophospholipid acyltransferase family protein [candidate division KSB1 bacterium]|nr:lysophospholipid acyltransferase family protein [candidate division KSB1 bacterium]
MKELDVRALIEAKNPEFFEKNPRFLTRLLVKMIEKTVRAREINDFLKQHGQVRGIAFIDELFEILDFSYIVSHKDIHKIPAEGRVILVANHPLGALDGLSLLKAVSEIRKDVKIIANDVLMNLENLSDYFLPYDVFSRKMQKVQVQRIGQVLQEDQAVIFFAAAEVSRLSFKGVRDPGWLNGPVFFAKKYKVPILPVFFKAKNSMLFYFISLFSKKVSMFLLPREVFKKNGKTIRMIIGDPIPGVVFSSSFINTKMATKLLKRHTYLIGRRKAGVFKTEKTIIHPLNRKIIKTELQHSLLLGETSDKKKIFLVQYNQATNVLHEIARLRELTFRSVGEGTGLKLDLDKFDRYYQHIVLWDEEELEIIGSYRIGNCKEIIAEHGITGLYTSTLFKYQEKAHPILERALELGRSFVQIKYWKSNALDYLWQGIGAYVAKNTDIKHLIGPVSISNTYTEEAKNLLVYYYKKWYPGDTSLAPHISPYIISGKHEEQLKQLFDGADIRQDMRKLKEFLRVLGFSIPILYKQYSELCEPGGVQFIDFGIDKDFGDCIDGLILVNLDYLKESKRKRYITVNLPVPSSETEDEKTLSDK